MALAIGNANVELSGETNLQMDDAPSMKSGPTGSVTAVSTVSMFTSNSTAFKSTVSANWKLLRDNAVVVANVQQYSLAP